MYNNLLLLPLVGKHLWLKQLLLKSSKPETWSMQEKLSTSVEKKLVWCFPPHSLPMIIDFSCCSWQPVRGVRQKKITWEINPSFYSSYVVVSIVVVVNFLVVFNFPVIFDFLVNWVRQKLLERSILHFPLPFVVVSIVDSYIVNIVVIINFLAVVNILVLFNVSWLGQLENQFYFRQLRRDSFVTKPMCYDPH